MLGWLVVSMSTSHTVSRGFASRPGHTKNHNKNGTNCLPAWHPGVRVRVSLLAVQPDCGKGWVACGTLFGDMHYKDLLGSITREEYCIPIPDFFSRATWPLIRKSTLMPVTQDPTTWI